LFDENGSFFIFCAQILRFVLSNLILDYTVRPQHLHAPSVHSALPEPTQLAKDSQLAAQCEAEISPQEDASEIKVSALPEEIYYDVLCLLCKERDLKHYLLIFFLISPLVQVTMLEPPLCEALISCIWLQLNDARAAFQRRGSSQTSITCNG